MLKDAERTLWELEFSKFRTLNVRESIRRQHDQTKEALNRLEAALKGDAKNEALLKDKAEVDGRLAHIKAQLDDIDARVYGVLPSETYPEGVVGVVQKIDNIIETRSNLQDFIKKYC